MLVQKESELVLADRLVLGGDAESTRPTRALGFLIGRQRVSMWFRYGGGIRDGSILILLNAS